MKDVKRLKYCSYFVMKAGECYRDLTETQVSNWLICDIKQCNVKHSVIEYCYVWQCAMLPKFV